MTGPEHYRRAEYLLELANGQDSEQAAYSHAEAQVHATLALTAATVDAAYSAMSIDADAAWERVTRPPQQASTQRISDHEIEDTCKCGFRAPELGPHPACPVHAEGGESR